MHSTALWNTHRLGARFTRASLTAVVIGLTLIVGAACSDDDADGIDRIEVTIGDESVSVDPPRIRIGDTFEVTVDNQSATDCRFDFGGFVRALDVPAGESVSSEAFEAVTVTGDRMTVGCEDEARQASIDILNIGE